MPDAVNAVPTGYAIERSNNTGGIPTVYENGVFRFAIGREFGSMYDLIEAQ